MGEVFLGRPEGAVDFTRPCVIKKILPQLAGDPEFVGRFVAEARVLAKLAHASIAQVLDLGIIEGAPYLALEFIDGKDLRRVLARMRERRSAIPLPFALFVMTRVLDALAYAHRRRDDNAQELQLVHRDISPQNLIVGYEGEVKLIDFGLAKSSLSTTETNPSILVGKFLYMSPEQARHQRVDRRSDLYAAGLCLYELVTGTSPFEGTPPGELLSRVQSPKLRPLADAAPRCPLALSQAVMKALAVDPAARYASAEEFRGALSRILYELDPLAGPETVGAMMRELFATEYQTERKTLALAMEQGRQLLEGNPPQREGTRETGEVPSANPFAGDDSTNPDALPAADVVPELARKPRVRLVEPGEPSVVVKAVEERVITDVDLAATPPPKTDPMMRPFRTPLEHAAAETGEYKAKGPASTTADSELEAQPVPSATITTNPTLLMVAEAPVRRRLPALLVLPLTAVVVVAVYIVRDITSAREPRPATARESPQSDTDDLAPLSPQKSRNQRDLDRLRATYTRLVRADANVASHYAARVEGLRARHVSDDIQLGNEARALTEAMETELGQIKREAR